jgi:DNA-binding transcriptional regulator YdaS (Cro superfamily)
MKLSDWQKQNGVTSRKLAELVNIHESHMCKVLKGKRELSPKAAARISEATNGEVTVMELLFPDQSQSLQPGETPEA